MNSSDEDFKTNFSNYFDLYSILDYYCFSYLTAHIDGLGKNMLMATYDGVHWGACLYDMDSIYGADWDGKSFKSTTIKCPEEYQETNSLLWQRIVTNFSQELYDRYFELRNGALSLGNIVTHVEEIYDLIPDRVFNDDYQKWSAIPGRTENTITRFRNSYCRLNQHAIYKFAFTTKSHDLLRYPNGYLHVQLHDHRTSQLHQCYQTFLFQQNH